MADVHLPPVDVAETTDAGTTADFLGLERVDDLRYRLPVVPAVCSGLGALFGGCGLAAGVVVLEEALARPVAWATAQYLSFARPPAVLDIEVREVVRGHQVSQARAVIAENGNEILTVNAALGSRPSMAGHGGVWVEMPDVPPPDASPPRRLRQQHIDSVAARIDSRLANAVNIDEIQRPAPGGRSALWARVHSIDTTQQTPAGLLAILGDYLPFGIGQALGRPAGGNSLDNTIRIVHRHPSKWILADIRVSAVSDGFAHGSVYLWNEDGRLLASGSQTGRIKVFEEVASAAADEDH